MTKYVTGPDGLTNVVRHFEPAPQPSGMDTSKIHDEANQPEDFESTKAHEEVVEEGEALETSKVHEEGGAEGHVNDLGIAPDHEGGGEIGGGLGGAAGFLVGQVTGLASAVGGLAKSFGQNIVLGRVHGLQGQIRAALNNPQALTNLAVGAAAQLAESEGKTIAAVIGERIHPDADVHGLLQGDENILGLGPPGPGPLEPSNIHDD